MGAGVSGWRLARAVSRSGQLGVVSGTALDLILVRRLQLGDAGGHVRRALAAFPLPEVAARIQEEFFIPGGKDPRAPFKAKSMVGHDPSRRAVELLVVAAFVEVHLAREGHDGLVGINLLEKIQTPNLPTLHGAMLASVDVVTIGAGVPLDTTGVLEAFATGRPATVDLHLPVTETGPPTQLTFDPAEFHDGAPPRLKRPLFLPIVSSNVLASMMMKRCSGGIDGFVVETPTAGGHNAPPRGRIRLDDHGAPVYGRRDVVDYAAIRSLGLPFWIGGSHGSPRMLREARALGASGIQVGTLFAFCDESGIESGLKQRVRDLSLEERLEVRTDPIASPTGFPFKVLMLPGTNAEESCYRSRERRCDLGYLRQPYRRSDGDIGWRCPADAVAAFVRKGGAAEDAIGRKCLCNGLMANIGLAQRRPDGRLERPLLTAGDDVCEIRRLMSAEEPRYSAGDVLAYLLSAE